MQYKDINDYELLYLIEEENDDARYLLYEKYLPMLRTMTTKYYRYLKDYGIEYDDLFQEVYIAFLNTIKLFDEKENTLFYTFLRININSKLLNYARIITSQKNLFYNNMVSLNSLLSCNSSTILVDFIKDDKQEDPSDLVQYNEVLKKLELFNLELCPSHSQIFELLCGGFDNREIAILLDITVKEVSNILYRIRKRLKLYLSSSQS